MRPASLLCAIALLTSSQAKDLATLRSQAESAFADEGLKLSEEFLKKAWHGEARFVAGLVGSRVATAKEKAEKRIEEIKGSKAKPAAAAKETETKVAAFGKKWAGEWRKAAKAGGGKEAARLEVEAEILDVLWEHARATVHLNRRRAEAGIGLVDYDFGLAYGCQMHAKWLVANPKAEDRHEEKEGTPGYSEEGKKAGEEGVLCPELQLTSSIEFQLASLYHRTEFIWSTAARVGMGWVQGKAGWTVMHLPEGEREGPAIVVYPPVGSQGVPLKMCPEIPSPIPIELEYKVGYPVTVTFFEAPSEVKAVQAQLIDVTDGKRDVECYLSTPEKPANDQFGDNIGTICLIPKTGLKPNSKYSVKVKFVYKGEQSSKEWEFSTGSREYPE